MKRKRIIIWASAIIFGLAVVVLVAGYFVLRSEGFHRYVLATIVKQGNEATGGRVEVQNFDFRFSTLTAHFYDFTIHGTEASSAQPLLQVSKVTVGLKILSVMHGRVNLNELLVEHPVVNLVVDKSGRNNIPEPNAPKNKSSQTNVFDLAVGHVLISNGEIYYNDRKSAVDADVRDLRAETHFDNLTTSYSGTISYHNGHIQYAGIAPLPHSLDAQFRATPSALKLPSLVFTVGSSRVSLQATINNYADPEIEGIYNIQVHTQDVAKLIPATPPAGDVFLSGQLSYKSAPNHSLLRDVVVDGQLHSDLLRVRSAEGHIEFRRLDTRYHLANGNFQTQNFSVDLLGGRVTGLLAAQNVDTTPRTKVHMAMNGISLQAVRTALKSTASSTVPLTGTFQGSVDASWTGSFTNLMVQSDLEIRASATNSSGSSSIPVNGVVHASYDGRRNVVTVRQTTISTPHSSILANGEIGDRSSLTIHVDTSDLHEVALLVTMAPSANAKVSQPVDMSGVASVFATVKGSLSKPTINAQVNARNFTFEGSRWSALSLTAEGSPSRISIQQGSLISSHQGQISFSGNAQLHDWSYIPSDQLALNVSLKQMPIGQIEQLASAHYPVDGILSGDVFLRGTQSNPVGSGSLHLIKARVADEPVNSLDAQFKAANGSINSSVQVGFAAGSASASLAFIPRTKSYKAEIHAPGIVLSKLQTLRDRNLPLNGTLTISATGEGTLDDPNLTATIQSTQLQLRDNSITSVKVELDVAHHQAKVVLSADAAQSTIRARGTINLSGDYYTEANIDTSKIPLEPLLAIYIPDHPSGFNGSTEIHATLKGPLKDSGRLEAHLDIPTLIASYQTLQLENTSPIRVDYANSVVVIQPSEMKGTDSDLQFQGRVPLTGGERMKATAKGSVNLRLLQIFSSDIKSSGKIVLDVDTQGTVSRPIVHGQVRLQDASFSTPSAPLGLGHANGLFDLGTDQLHITQFTGQVGGGDVTAGGTITYRPEVQFNLAVQAKSVRLLYPEGLRTILDSDLNLNGTMHDATLGGRVLIDSLSFTPDFDISTFTDQFTGPTVPSASPGFADAVKLNVSIQSTGDLSAASSQVSLQGQANLRAIGTAASPVIVGRADLNSGDLFFLSNRYQIQRGVFSFNNPNETEPIINLAATTTIQQYTLTVNVNGPLDKLQTSYVSDPPLSTVDIINLIARGETAQQADSTNLSANSLIAQGVASKLSSGVQKLAGLSSLSIDPLLGGNNTNPSARIAVQQRFTKNFYFTFSTDVTQPQTEIVQGEYQISKRWSVSANRDAAGGIAVDGKFRTNF